MDLNKPITIASNRISKIVIVKNEFERPALILSKYLSKITGADFKINDVTSVNPQIIFRKANHGVDGFAYRIFDKDIIIEAANETATVYAIYDFLENILGCRYYAENCEYIPFDANLTVQFFDYAFSPILNYREILYHEYFNQSFSEKHKMTAHNERNKVWGYWCHSFQILCNPKDYFDEHPEYFSLYEGKRVGENAELCLSNPDVLEIVVANLQKLIDKNPTARYWSVSQNDNNAFCQCDACKAIDDVDGTPMGSILNFVNKVAERFPDKIISTLAYWYSRTAPKVTRPAKNVHIMLCNIEANRGLPIETDSRSTATRTELTDWKNICDNVFLWDYCIQFRNLCSPFPNLRVIAPNIRYFVENNVRSLFSQANREFEGEFAQLRGYMLAKLSWNPYADADKIMKNFVFGYYKSAGKYILEYINLIHDELEKSNGELNIFGGPLDCNSTYLREELYNRYQALFDSAEESVANDLDTLFRVKNARLPLYYAGICLKYGNKSTLMSIIQKFAVGVRKTGLVMVEEWTITADKFITNALAELNELDKTTSNIVV